ncbi:MAG TPA: hypothetical protein VG435_04715 [Acidimicrobiales bacterium]|jgi:phosphoglycerate dehydrogenase-like enzyme|nr:hypothetical protein [Acidimicrobiales bacterium]
MRIALGPSTGEAAGFALAAVRDGGGTVVELGQAADGLVWLSAHDMDGLKAALAEQPGIRWVQLPFAGVEKAVAAGVIDDRRAWTCAKGSYARPVAEHALMLALAGLRILPERISARSWGRPAGRMLYDAPVTIVGGGGITEELLRLMAPWNVSATVVRRQAGVDLPGAPGWCRRRRCRRCCPARSSSSWPWP